MIKVVNQATSRLKNNSPYCGQRHKYQANHQQLLDMIDGAYLDWLSISVCFIKIFYIYM